MHHLAGLYKSLGAGTVYGSLTAQADQAMPVDANGNALLQYDGKIMGVSVLGNGDVNARLTSPMLQSVFLPEVYPIISAATVPDSATVYLPGDFGVPFRANDPLNIQVSNPTAGALDTFGLLWVGNKQQLPPAGPTFTIPYTATPTLIKGAWVNVAIATTQQLPSGRYRIVGMAAVGTGWYGVRLAFVGSNANRPGIIGQPSYGFALRDPYFRHGNFDTYGEFTNTAPPSIDVFGLVAGAQAGTVWLDLQKIG